MHGQAAAFAQRGRDSGHVYKVAAFQVRQNLRGCQSARGASGAPVTALITSPATQVIEKLDACELPVETAGARTVIRSF